MTTTLDKILSGQHLAGARLISQLESRDPKGIVLLKQLYPHTGNGLVVGITGPPGAGKSTMVDRMISEFRRRGERVGVLAVDPTSPYSGGALLGDRVRMQGHELDDNVFIRSMANRGRMGGIGQSAREAALVLDAMGHGVILIETVGVGQGEIDIIGLAHTTIVVSIPGMGDDIQAMKAGLLEIGDIFAVNKSDLDGADEVVRLLEGMLHLRSDSGPSWQPPVLKTVAVKNEGIDALVDACYDFRKKSLVSGELARRAAENQIAFFRQVVTELAAEKILNSSTTETDVLDLSKSVSNREIDPYTAAEQLLSKVLR